MIIEMKMQYIMIKNLHEINKSETCKRKKSFFKRWFSRKCDPEPSLGD